MSKKYKRISRFFYAAGPVFFGKRRQTETHWRQLENISNPAPPQKREKAGFVNSYQINSF